MRVVNDLLDLQAGAQNGLVVTLPSASLDEGSTYWFGLRVTMGLGLWSEASVEVFKSTDALPALKVGTQKMLDLPIIAI